MKVCSFIFSSILASVVVPGQAQQPGYVYTDLGTFATESTIATGYGGCLGDRLKTRTNPNTVRLQTCTEYDPRAMTFTTDTMERIVQKSTGRCLEWTGAASPTDADAGDGSVHLVTCSESDHQKWYTDDGMPGTIKSRAPGNQCLEYYCVSGYCHVKTATCTGTNTSTRGQKWQSSPPPTRPPTTSPPTDAPTTPAPTLVPTIAPRTASSSGDPHFVTFGGHKFDFHGGCDLVLLSNPSFGKGLSMSVHIRTKIENWWSYIEAAVIQIGDLTLEVKGGPKGGGPHYWVNGLAGSEDASNDANLRAFEVELEAHFPGFKVHYKHVSAKQHKFRIDLNHAGDAISIETFKDWVAVNVKAVKPEIFGGAKGLMGTHPTGAMVARNMTLMADATAFGQEWQVLSTEPMLFHDTQGAQHPDLCQMPNTAEVAASKKRRLGESLMTHEDAELACVRVSPDSFDQCVFDVLATNDKDMAGAY